MPRPPVFPALDWKAIFESGVSFDDWLKQAESPDNRKQIKELYGAMRLAPHETAMLEGLGRPVRIVAIAEDWCGDVVRQVPVLMRLAAASERLAVRFVWREQYPEMFARFLTNGGEAIPKFIFLNDQYVECGNWGPMPYAWKKLIARGKAAGDVAAAREKIKMYYEADPQGRQSRTELLELIDVAVSDSV